MHNPAERHLAAYLNRISRQQLEEDAQESRNDTLRSYYATCRAIADGIVFEFAFANGQNYYRQYGLDCNEADWHDWLVEEAEAFDKAFGPDGSAARAMRLLISEQADFTGLDFVAKQADIFSTAA